MTDTYNRLLLLMESQDLQGIRDLMKEIGRDRTVLLLHEYLDRQEERMRSVTS